MKAKLVIVLLAGLLLAGCGTSNNTANDSSSQMENAQTDSQEDTQSTGKEGTQGGTQEELQADTEKEPEVLKFETSTVDGERMDASCFSGSKLTMINVWATYCDPCLSEMPDLGEIAASYDSAEFQIIGLVSDVVDGADEADIQEAKELIEETKANYPHLLLSVSLYNNLVANIDAVPTTYFVNEKGEILGYTTGARSKEDWETLINEVLEEMQ